MTNQDDFLKTMPEEDQPAASSVATHNRSTSDWQKGGDAPSFTTRDAVRLLFKHKWTILIPFVVISALGITYSQVATTWYRATATIQIRPGEMDDILPQGQIVSRRQKLLNDQIQILRADVLLEKVVEDLYLDSRIPAFMEQELGDGDRVSLVIELLKRQILFIEPVIDSNFIRISAQWPGPDLAASIPNTLAEKYVDSVQNQLAEQAESFSLRYSDQAEQTQQRIKEVTDQISEFLQEHEIPSVEGQIISLQNELTGVQQELRIGRTDLVGLREQISSLEQALLIEPPDISDSTTVTANPEYVRVKQYLDEMYLQRATALGTWQESSSVIQRIDAQIEEAVRKLTRLEQNAVAGKIIRRNPRYEQIRSELTRLRPMYEATNVMVSGLQQELDNINQQLVRFAKIRQQYENMQIERAMLQEQLAYERNRGTLADQKQVFVDKIADVSISDRARRPTRASYPNKVLFAIISLVAGLGLGGALSVLSEVMNHTLETADDVEKYLGVTVLGTIPDKAYKVKL